MTYHPDSFKPQAPSSYYCSECKYRHNKGSIRYHDHWMWRTATPEALKKSQHPWRHTPVVTPKATKAPAVPKKSSK